MLSITSSNADSNNKYENVRPGEIYIFDNPEIADQYYEEADNFLKKILDANSVTKASMWFLDAEKLYYLQKQDLKTYKNLQRQPMDLRTKSNKNTRFNRSQLSYFGFTLRRLWW